MLTPATQAKLKNPAYFALHLQAARAIQEVAQFGWYDSHFLRRFEVARCYLSKVRPDALPGFVAGFAPLRPERAIPVTLIDEVFDAATRALILKTCHAAAATDNARQAFESRNFGRDVVWDEPLFGELQDQIRPLLEELVGCPLEPSYTFLSRYRDTGVCPPHLDHPDSMFTFDYCVEQSGEWPIYFSRAVDWPTREAVHEIDLNAIKHDPALDFTPHTLRPNQALLFNGSSRWHYRDPIALGGFCNLLFFHYIPAGCRDLVVPGQWAAHFAIPELEALCDLFQRMNTDELV